MSGEKVTVHIGTCDRWCTCPLCEPDRKKKLAKAQNEEKPDVPFGFTSSSRDMFADGDANDDADF